MCDFVLCEEVDMEATMNCNLLAGIDIGGVGLSGVVLLGIGLMFVVILTVAYARLKVEQDPTVEAILDVLPGANCGGCGLAGCGAYAEAVVADHGLMGKCGPGGDELVHKMAEILGIKAGVSAPIRPIVHCSAKEDDRINSAAYSGVASCAEAQMVVGAIGCAFGCMGYGDCVAVCDFDAINIIDGLAEVDYDKCVGCGACVDACPRGLIELVSFDEDPLMVVGCSSPEKAKAVKGYCKVGCVGCTLCAKQAPGMFEIKNSLAVIDYSKYGSKEERDKAVEKCPRDMLVYVGKN